MNVLDSQGNPPLITPQFLLLLLATAVFGLSFSTYFLLPKYVALELNADAITIGAVSAVSMLASVFAMPVVGVLVDKHRRSVFGTLGALTFGMASLGYLWIDSVGPLLWIVRVFQGTAFTLYYVSISTLATDISPPSRLGQAIGLFGAVMISTNAFGPAIAEWVAEHYGWRRVFISTISASFVAAALTTLLAEERRKITHHESASMLEVLKRPALRNVLVVVVLAGWTMGAVYSFYQPWALSLGFTRVSTFLVAFAVSAMTVRIGLGGMADRLGRLRVATVALFLYIGAPLSLLWLDIFGLFFCGAILGLAHGLFFPALNAVALGYTSGAEKGKGMAAFHGAFNVGFAAGSYLLGFIIVSAGYPAIFLIAGGTCAIAFLLLARLPEQSSETGR